MRVRTVRNPRIVPAVLTAAGLALLTAVPADAATTTVTFTLTGGALTISAPATANLGTAAVGTATLSGSLGAVTVTDARGALLGTWTASVFSTNFTTGGGTPSETIAATAVNYASLTATSTTGTAVFTPGQATVGLAAPLGTTAPGLTAFSATAIVGNNTATWNPTLVVNIPSAAVAGTYTGTVTHSVA
ncbi:hypothetical protein [Frankia inefficax]|uniref:WxL domain-containing protein n=1 Tax=Pseudofrankia inefficax (strain DSM 45817 / CECT 9037 / DDB 130130 / EuI1c) TaxID=298654 RepID=E3J2T1_PSEI1|nr:hypothetical protein FraEuI1c_3735 [Pseudofrankia inefficax]